MTRHRNPAGTQEDRVMEALETARNGRLTGPYLFEGGWIGKQYFLRIMGLTQAGRAIWNLEHVRKVQVEHSSFADEYGFRYYRLKPAETLFEP